MMPMKYFTNEGLKPSERTLKFIKQFAYSYRVVKQSDGTKMVLSLN